MTELPPRLSDHQKFILSFLARNQGTMPVTPTSRALAKEFHTEDEYPWWSGGARILTRDLSQTGPRASYYTKPEVGSSYHSSAFSRTLNRLENRGLISSNKEHGKRQSITLTDKGERVGEEILRRHRDGRYNLEFENIDV